jgi:RNA exonuclease 1
MAPDTTSTLENGTGLIALNPETLQRLNSLVPSLKALRQAGYVVEPLTDHELEQKRRCLTCGVRSELRGRSSQSDPWITSPSGKTDMLRSRQESTPRAKPPGPEQATTTLPC